MSEAPGHKDELVTPIITEIFLFPSDFWLEKVFQKCYWFK